VAHRAHSRTAERPGGRAFRIRSLPCAVAVRSFAAFRVPGGRAGCRAPAAGMRGAGGLRRRPARAG
jgi:hypothetical protein